MSKNSKRRARNIRLGRSLQGHHQRPPCLILYQESKFLRTWRCVGGFYDRCLCGKLFYGITRFMLILLITCVDVACTHSAQNPNFDSYTYLDVAHRGFGKKDTASPPSSQQATSSGSASYLVNTMTRMTSVFCLYVSVCVCVSL